MNIDITLPLSDGRWVYTKVSEKELAEMLRYSRTRGFRIAQYVDAVICGDQWRSQQKVELNVHGRSIRISARISDNSEVTSAAYTIPDKQILTADEAIQWLTNHGVSEERARQVVHGSHWAGGMFTLLAKAYGKEGTYESLCAQ